jgi:hypothetical protein
VASPAVIRDAEQRCDEYERAVMSGAELVLDGSTLLSAFMLFDDRMAARWAYGGEFGFQNDRDGTRRWRLTESDELCEVTGEESVDAA